MRMRASEYQLSSLAWRWKASCPAQVGVMTGCPNIKRRHFGTFINGCGVAVNAAL
jgi:hypothetical protein